MTYEAMAHSHLQRTICEGMGLTEVRQDDDGDYPFRHGTAVYYLSMGRGGHLVKIWSHAVHGLRPTAAVLRETNAANERLMHSRAYLSGSALVIEAMVPVEPLTPAYLAAVCHEVGCTADRIGQLMAAVHGGVVCFDDETETADG